MKKILVPVDFSNHSEYALKTASILAKKWNASIVALHMLGISEAVFTKEDSEDIPKGIYFMKLAEKRFNDFLDRDYLEGVSIETTVQNHTEFNKIDEVAKKCNADLIVMGSHGASGMKEVFVGSNTEKVVRTSSVPVLVIKNKMNDFYMNKVVFACDFNLDYLPSFKKAYQFFNALNIKLQLVFVNLPEKFISTEEMEERALKFMLNTGIENTDLFDDIVYYADYSLESGIYNFCNKFDADLLVIPTHGRKGLAHFFSENLGEALVNHVQLPIMTFKI
ncbi:universal stress protein [Mesonia maritima]|uniref:Nucleotide-binding universal stress UspA family protein n=1 Tax=Mesonia maritima TaxID=1793873 RepID=A0ABU1K7F8_9FLAO|nr:universal stress protein [Mesonia maritima]MDR6301548.1 nucleotide-binding universal stress UspA family protein [Mesonia maritima]